MNTTQGRVLIGEGALIRDGALILFSSPKHTTNESLINNNGNCNTKNCDDMVSHSRNSIQVSVFNMYYFPMRKKTT